MKSIQERIVVDARNRVPRRLQWDGRTYRVRRLIDYWILQTRWWGREEKRIYFRLETNRGTVEVYRAAESLPSGLAPPDSESTIRPTTRPAPTTRPTSGLAVGKSESLEHRSSTVEKASLPVTALPLEGDTHTRERRRTDAAYRPDVRIEENLRRRARAAGRDRPERVRWVLSKIVD